MLKPLGVTVAAGVLLWAAMTGLLPPDPVVLTAAVLGLTGGLIGTIVSARRIARSRRPVPQDPVRDYPPAIRKQSFSLAGNRCEYTSSWGRRCKGPAQHADHFWPWVRGGATSLRNCVASCARHNTSKGAKILPRSAQRSLQRRRRRYYTPGTDTSVGEWYAAPAPASIGASRPDAALDSPEAATNHPVTAPATTTDAGQPAWAREPAKW